ncbi:uncharacterized protein [Oscarella lobularis]|uniref:uncharacterized protein n=1 Tax=Oscarella lobularis TaxID=121494 RepID=UPI003313D1CD
MESQHKRGVPNEDSSQWAEGAWADERVRSAPTHLHVLQRGNDDEEEVEEERMEAEATTTRQMKEDEELARRLQEEEDGISRQEEIDEEMARRLQQELNGDPEEFSLRDTDLFPRISIIPDRREAEERERRQRRRTYGIFRHLLRHEEGWSSEDFGGATEAAAFRNFLAALQAAHRPDRRPREMVEDDSVSVGAAARDDSHQQPVIIPDEERNAIDSSPSRRRRRSSDRQPQGLRLGSLLGLASPLDFEELLRLDEMLGQIQRGTDQETIDRYSSVGKFSASSAGENKQCVVCMTDFVEGEDIRRLPCFHTFHIACIDPWLKTNRVCPVCRIDIDMDQ